MTTQVALLRGINVGRAKQVPMAELKAVFEGCGCTDVATVLRSGNVVYSSDQRQDGLGEALEAELLRRTGVQSSMLLLDSATLLRIAADNPLADVGTDPSRLFVGFTSEPPLRTALGEAAVPAPDLLAPEVLVVGERAVYQWCPDGVSSSRVPASFWKLVAPVVTVRNWRTVTRLVDLVTSAGGHQ